MTWRQWIFVILTFVLGGILGLVAGFFAFGGRSSHKERESASEVPEIVYRTDTVRIDRPVPSVTRILDTIYVTCMDTVTIHDTLYHALERTQKIYEKDSSYRAVVSGYMPALDSIEVYDRTQTIVRNNIVKVRKKWSIGVGAQCGIGYVSRFGGGSGIGMYTGIGLGIQYSF